MRPLLLPLKIRTSKMTELCALETRSNGGAHIRFYLLNAVVLCLNLWSLFYPYLPILSQAQLENIKWTGLEERNEKSARLKTFGLLT